MPRRIVAVGLGIALAGLVLTTTTVRTGRVAEQVDVDPTLLSKVRLGQRHASRGREPTRATMVSFSTLGDAVPVDRPSTTPTAASVRAIAASVSTIVPAATTTLPPPLTTAATVPAPPPAPVPPASDPAADAAAAAAAASSAESATGPGRSDGGDDADAVEVEAASVEETTTTAAAEAAASSAAASSASGAGGSGGSEALSQVRLCESGGDYGAVSSGGSYRGAYQFSPGTWNSVASRWYPDLVGVDPASASPAAQDAMAQALYEESGSSPWPNCG